MFRRPSAVAILLAAISIPSLAQQATRPVKVAVIDTERILLNSAAGKKAMADLKKLQEQKETELRKRAEELKALQKQITDGRVTFSQQKLQQLTKQFEDKEIAMRRLQDDATRELSKKRDEAVSAIDRTVMPVINRIGKELGYTLIFRKYESGLIFADEAVDITEVIIKRLDAPPAPAPAKK